MSDRAAFIASILAAPADSTPRLVYADWLSELPEDRFVDPVVAPKNIGVLRQPGYWSVEWAGEPVAVERWLTWNLFDFVTAARVFDLVPVEDEDGFQGLQCCQCDYFLPDLVNVQANGIVRDLWYCVGGSRWCHPWLQVRSKTRRARMAAKEREKRNRPSLAELVRHLQEVAG